MNLLTKCFQVLYTNKNDSSWSMKYFQQFNEKELLDRIAQLEDINQTEQQVCKVTKWIAQYKETFLTDWTNLIREDP